jgi:Holliday junction resolvasome RuvABC ATP-dependent DNA helicase subunit
MTKERVINPKPTIEDKELDNELRPTSWQDFAGQKKINLYS